MVVDPYAVQETSPPDASIPVLAVSPDGRTLLLAQYDQYGSNIIMVERLR
jgi:hypothetical protein